MDYRPVGIARPVPLHTIKTGDLFVVEYRTVSVFALKVRWAADSLALVLHGHKALGSAEPFLVNFNAVPDACALFQGPFSLRPGVPARLDVKAEPLNGSLWMSRDGDSYVRMRDGSQIAFFSLKDGEEGKPGDGHRRLTSWVLDAGPDSAPVRILTVNGP